MRHLAVGTVGLLIWVISVWAQSGNSGTVHGSVADPSGAVIKGAVASIQNPVSQYSRATTTDDHGKFEFENVPFNNYHVTISAKGFQLNEQDAVRTTHYVTPRAITATIGFTSETGRVLGRVRP